MGNIVLYAGMGASTIATGLQIVDFQYISNGFLFASTALFGFSVALLGCAKFAQNKVDLH